MRMRELSRDGSALFFLLAHFSPFQSIYPYQPIGTPARYPKVSETGHKGISEITEIFSPKCLHH